MTEIVCGVFPSRGQAENALEALIKAGFARPDLGIALKVYLPAAARAAGAGERDLHTAVPNQRVVTLPNVGDTIVGGTIATCLGEESQQRSLDDALARLGIVPSHAAWYADEVCTNHILVTLRTGDPAKAQAVMRQFGSLDVAPAQRMPGPDSTSNLDNGARPSSPEVVSAPSPTVETPVHPISRIQPGYDVFTGDGFRLGTVAEVADNCIHVVIVQDIFLPPDRIRDIEPGRVVLNVLSGDINNLDWSACQLESSTTSEPGEPGGSGLFPQAHEEGVNIPVEPSD